MSEPIYTKSSGNLFKDIGYPDEEADDLMNRCKMMLEINKLADTYGTPIKELRNLLKLSTLEVIDMRKGRAHKFSAKNLKIYLKLFRAYFKD